MYIVAYIRVIQIGSEKTGNGILSGGKGKTKKCTILICNDQSTVPASFPGGMVHFFFFSFSTDNTKVTPSAEFGPELSGAAPRYSLLLLLNCASRSNGHNNNRMHYHALHAALTCTHSQCL